MLLGLCLLVAVIGSGIGFVMPSWQSSDSISAAFSNHTNLTKTFMAQGISILEKCVTCNVESTTADIIATMDVEGNAVELSQFVPEMHMPGISYYDDPDPQNTSPTAEPVLEVAKPMIFTFERNLDTSATSSAGRSSLSVAPASSGTLTGGYAGIPVIVASPSVEVWRRCPFVTSVNPLQPDSCQSCFHVNRTAVTSPTNYLLVDGTDVKICTCTSFNYAPSASMKPPLHQAYGEWCTPMPVSAIS
jgi:hypothetical protein